MLTQASIASWVTERKAFVRARVLCAGPVEGSGSGGSRLTGKGVGAAKGRLNCAFTATRADQRSSATLGGGTSTGGGGAKSYWAFAAKRAECRGGITLGGCAACSTLDGWALCESTRGTAVM